MIAAFMRGVTRLNDFIGRWVALLIFAMFVFLLLEVGFRYLLNSPTVWTNELTQMLFGIYAVMSGGDVAPLGLSAPPETHPYLYRKAAEERAP